MSKSPDIREYRDVLTAALKHDDLDCRTFENVVEAVEQGELQFWPGERSAIVTQVVNYPTRRVLHFFLAGGKLDELETMVPMILDWGKQQWGCSAATFTGRKGWGRTFLRTSGWEPLLVHFGRAL